LASGYALGQNSRLRAEIRAACNRLRECGEYKGSRSRLSAREDHLKELLVRGLSGEADAYHAFLGDLSGFLRGYLRGRLSRMPDEVEDLVQETLLAVHNQRHTFDASLPLTAWVRAIARYKLVDFLRRRAGRDAITDPLGDDDELLGVSDEEAREAKRDMATLLARLPDRHRLPIQHVKIEGLSVAEAAKLTGMSESAVKVGIHRGLKALAAFIRD
jgi:RNA polymerase sigma-70 factor, ECF subfamily